MSYALLMLPLLELLFHELGHAIVALVCTRGRVTVAVGRPPGLIRFRLGRLRVQWSPEPTRGTSWRGVCLFDAPPRPVPYAWILLAGPAASLLYAAICLVVASIAPVPSTLARLWIAVAALQGLATAALNGDAFFREKPRRQFPDTDGARARTFLAADRALRDAEVLLGRRLTDVELRRAARGERIRYVGERQSVAPPEAVRSSAECSGRRS